MPLKFHSVRKKDQNYWVTKAYDFFEIRTHGGGAVIKKINASLSLREIMQQVAEIGCKNLVDVYNDIVFLKRSQK